MVNSINIFSQHVLVAYRKGAKLKLESRHWGRVTSKFPGGGSGRMNRGSLYKEWAKASFLLKPDI